jgi:hypothetical protein
MGNKAFLVHFSAAFCGRTLRRIATLTGGIKELVKKSE